MSLLPSISKTLSLPTALVIANLMFVLSALGQVRPSGLVRYTSPQSNFSFVIRENAMATTVSSNSEGFVYTYDIYDGKKKLYTITVAKRNTSNDAIAQMIYAEDFEEGFRKKCNCIFMNASKASYSNVEGVKFLFKLLSSTEPMGLTFSFANGTYLYNVTFIGDSSTFSLFLKEFDEVLNSFELL